MDKAQQLLDQIIEMSKAQDILINQRLIELDYSNRIVGESGVTFHLKVLKELLYPTDQNPVILEKKSYLVAFGDSD